VVFQRQERLTEQQYDDVGDLHGAGIPQPGLR
jgi:hypothetical protein